MENWGKQEGGIMNERWQTGGPNEGMVKNMWKMWGTSNDKEVELTNSSSLQMCRRTYHNGVWSAEAVTGVQGGSSADGEVTQAYTAMSGGYPWVWQI